MDIDEVEQVGAAVKILEKHGYQNAADALKAVLTQEFAKVAESLHD